MGLYSITTYDHHGKEAISASAEGPDAARDHAAEQIATATATDAAAMPEAADYTDDAVVLVEAAEKARGVEQRHTADYGVVAVTVAKAA